MRMSPGVRSVAVHLSTAALLLMAWLVPYLSYPLTDAAAFGLIGVIALWL